MSNSGNDSNEEEFTPIKEGLKKSITFNPNSSNMNSNELNKSNFRKSIIDLEIENISKLIHTEEVKIEKTKSISYEEMISKIRPILEAIGRFFLIIIPPITTGYVKIREIYKKLPMDILYGLLGLVLAFFGGTFALSLVVIEAIYNSGWDSIKYNGELLYHELKHLWKKYQEEAILSKYNNDKSDKPADIKSDIIKKVDFFLVYCKDPKKIMDLITGIGHTLITVLAVIHSKFAKGIALGNSIGEAFKKPANYFFVPALTFLMPKKYHHWIYPVINYTCKAIAITLALILERVISTLQSGIRGGLMFSRRLLKYLNYKNYYKFDPEKSYLDEFIGWSVAALGVYFQIRNKFNLPFPMNVLCLPLSILEFTLEMLIEVK